MSDEAITLTKLKKRIPTKADQDKGEVRKTPKLKSLSPPSQLALSLAPGQKRFEETSSSEALGLETNVENNDNHCDAERIRKSITILNRTRESLLADESFLEKPSQLLDKALAKVISIRKEELDSKKPEPKNNVSVIVRCSTPDPDTTCKNNQDSHFPPTTPQDVPEDRSLPLSYFLKSFENLEEPPLTPHHPNQPSLFSSSAPPRAPWSPPPSQLVLRHQTNSLLGVLNTPSSSLIAPLKIGDPKEAKKMELNQDKEECEEKIELYKDLLRRYSSRSKTPATVQRNHQKWEDELSAALTDIGKAIRRFIKNHGQTLGSETVDIWKKQITEGERKFDEHLDEVTEVLANMSRMQVPPASAVSPSEPNPPDSAFASKAKAAEADVEVDSKQIIKEGKKLEKEVKAFEFWENASDEKIEEAMHSIEDWKKRMVKVQDRLTSIERNTLKFNLDKTKLSSTTAFIETLEEEMELKIRDIKEEDENRGLYSTSRSKAADVRLPKFGGRNEEDFFKFKKEMIQGFRSNKVKREDQVRKLRENLLDQPKTMISPDLKSIDDAWSILMDMYGDSSRVMAAKKQKLCNMGMYPSRTTRGGRLGTLKTQIEWVTKMEVLLKDIIELGEESEQHDRDAFGSDTILTVQGFLPFSMQKELDKDLKSVENDGKEQLEVIIEFLKESRSTSQRLQKIEENQVMKYRSSRTGDNTVESEDHNDGGTNGGGNNGKTRKQFMSKGQYATWEKLHGLSSNTKIKGFIAFKSPQKDLECRICKHLQKKGVKSGKLFEKHQSSIAIGCPNFMSMPLKERINIVKEVKLCDWCLHPKDEVNPGVLHDNCIVVGNAPPNAKKYFTCQDQSCNTHFLLCDAQHHFKANEERYEKTKQRWEKSGVKFKAHLSKILKVMPTSHAQLVKSFDDKESTACLVEEEVKNNDKPVTGECTSSFDANSNKARQGEETQVNLKEATEKLKEVVEGTKVFEVPEGEPLFLFSTTVGKTRPITVFYDKGCSHVIFKEGVPQHELTSVMTKKGPLAISGVGNTKVTVKDEWACLLDRADGSKQVVQGVAVDHITEAHPLIDISEAVDEVKADDPDNQELQQLRVPREAGGEADILFGILYENCHPVHIHTLPSGLFLAKLKLATPGNQWTGVIGGPHKSFGVLSQQAGDVTRLMAHFAEGIKNFENLGAPALHGPMMTWEDVQFATRMNKVEIEDCTDEYELFDDNVDLSGVENRDAEEFYDENPESNLFEGSLFDGNLDIQCGSCGKDLEEVHHSGVVDQIGEIIEETTEVEGGAAYFSDALETEDKLRELKIFTKMQELGLMIDYRCPACRSCHDCKNAPETERISLREEAEDQAIRESVSIDFDKKKITCILPLRGSEEEFLSNNRQSALKVLDGQCKKVKNDEEAKKTVIKSFYKLFDGGFARKFDDLEEEQKQQILKKKVQHYLPWRVVHKASLSTPCRTVMDASSKTPLLKNGEGGRCLNDATMKGKVDTLDLLKMLLRFQSNHVAFCGDLKQFYPSINLHPSQWNLQRVLWREGLSLDSPVVEIVILTLIFGVRAVSALSEKALVLLAEYIQVKNPRLADLLKKDRFVDDIGSSEDNHEIVKNIIQAANELFDSVSLSVKGWSVSGSEPHPDVSADGVSVDIGGMTWYPVIDTISVKTPPLHFGRKARGKLVAGTEVFEGSFDDLKKFVKKPLTRRQVVSKFSAWYDVFGKLTPLTAKMKVDVRRAVKETNGWDEAVPPDLHDKWIDNFWQMQKLQGLQFHRARIPEDAVDTNLHLICCVDAADSLKVVGIWARFKVRSGKFSSQLIIGRSLLSKGGTIPKEELEAATIGSNLLWVVRKALEGMVVDYSLFSDSMISLCWITSENKRLSLYHRNRVVQIRFHTDIDKLFHLRTDFNPADIGTRPEKVRVGDIGPESVWEKGYDWMRESMEDALEKGIITPAKDLKLSGEDKDVFDHGLIFEKFPEILVRGHSAFATSRVQKMKMRAEFSNYVFSPTAFSFRKVVRITAAIFKFMRKAGYQEKPVNNFRMFTAQFQKQKPAENSTMADENLVDFFLKEDPELENQFAGISWGASKPLFSSREQVVMHITDEDISMALEYWYTKGTREVIKYNKKEFLDKSAVLRNGILFCRSRIMDCQRFITAGGFPKTTLGKELGLNFMTPMLDRFSPIAYSVAKFIHEEVGKHAGYETSYRLSLGYCHIIQGASLFREIGDECVKCKMLRKKYIEVVMGPVSDHQLTISPPFYSAFCDLDGPYKVYVPGRERETRHTKADGVKVYIMTFICPVTKILNLQVIESKTADGVLEGLTRLGCEQGFPKYLILDQDSSFMKAVEEAEISLKDLQLRSFKEHGILCEKAPVSGHNFTGLVERKIKTVQECFSKINLESQRLHATGLQTLAKLVETSINNLPMGFSYGRDSNNTPLLRIITPNLMKIGRLNSRALDGPVRFPSGPKDIMMKVEKVFDAFYRIWNSSMVPKLIQQPKWFKDSPEVKADDVVYFQKDKSELSSPWTVGQVESVTKSKDGVVRRACVRYYNHSENQPRFTDRAVRSLVRLFNIEDNYFISDMAKVEEMMSELSKSKEEVLKVKPTKLVRNEDGTYTVKVKAAIVKRCKCCCSGHCKLYTHNQAGKVTSMIVATKKITEYGGDFFPHIYESDLVATNELDCAGSIKSLVVDRKDEIYDAMTALETNFYL